jgi:hypothetical protein
LQIGQFQTRRLAARQTWIPWLINSIVVGYSESFVR